MSAPGGPALGFIHRFVPGRSGLPPLLLLHGTGGNEDDLVSLGHSLLPDAPLLSPRGQVLEHGMPRFFRRLSEGVFDVDDLRRRSGELARFVAAARESYDLARPPVAVGFSNGANIGAALLLLHPGTLAGAVLLRPMVPLRPEPLPDLAGTPVLVLAGSGDPIVTVDQSEALASLLRDSGADVTMHWVPGGHRLTREDLAAASRWIPAQFGLSSLT